MNKPVLVIDDERSMREFLAIMLQKQGFTVELCDTGDDAIKRLQGGDTFQLVITDLKMPGDATGIDVLKTVKQFDPACQVVVMTAYATPESAIAAIREGAYDYLMKPFKVDEAKIIVHRAIEKYQLLSENHYLKEKLAQQAHFNDIIGQSSKIQQVFHLIERVAPTKTTILLSGESGTGKELAARAIHARSQASEGRFIAINCGAIPESLIESELFGHKKGAFTGAINDSIGLFEAAQNGTVFLDEVSELPLGTQVKLLRVLQERKIKPVGGINEISINCRILAATNKDLKQQVDEGTFREDLYYRLNVITIELPPLRERDGDIQLLLQYFIDKYSNDLGRTIEGIDAQAMKLLLNHSYPGNIRELQNIVERAVTLEPGSLITVDSLPPEFSNSIASFSPSLYSIPESGIELEKLVEEFEREWITKALDKTDGNKTDAAKLLGISFRSLRYRLQKYGID